MAKRPWNRPWVVFALSPTVGKREAPDCALAPAGSAAISATATIAEMRAVFSRRCMAASQRITVTEVAVRSAA